MPPMLACRLLVLDFDGVVLDSARIKAAAFCELFDDRPGSHGDEILALHHRMTGQSRFRQFEAVYQDILHEPLTETQSRHLGERYSELFRDQILSCKPVPGALEFLERHHRDHPIWLASGSPHQELLATLEHRDLRAYFAGVEGAPTLKADTVRTALAHHGCAPAEAAFVGDAITDQAAAGATDLRFLGVVQPGDSNPFPDGTSTIVDLHQLGSLLGWTTPDTPEGRAG